MLEFFAAEGYSGSGRAVLFQDGGARDYRAPVAG